MKNISEIQNEKVQLQRLAAQRQLYDEARKRKVWRLLVTVPGAIVWAIVATFAFKNDVVTVIGGLCIAAFDMFLLSHLEQSLRQKAARIQELFDCEVLQIEWNKDLLGVPPASDDIAEYASKYAPEKYSPLEDWYSPAVDKLPLHFGRIVCQRANMSWDAKLRRRYIKIIGWTLALLTGLIIVAGILLQRQQLSNYLFIPAALLPALLFGLQEIYRNWRTTTFLSQLKEKANERWQQAFSGKVTEDEIVRSSRNWQNEIYQHRKNSPLIPGWIYTRYRDTDEGVMWESSGALVEEALRRLQK